MRDHRSLEAWKEAHAVVGGVLSLAESHWKPGLAAVFRQLTAAALSVQINIAEGYALGTRAMFQRHLRIAYGSSVEADDLLELLRERRAVPTEMSTTLLWRCRRSQRLILGLLHRYAKR